MSIHRRLSMFAILLAGGMVFVASGVAQPPAPHLLDALRHRVAVQPHDASSWRLLGQLLEQQGDLTGACHALEQSVRLAPDSAAAHCHLARVLAETGVLPRAAEHWRQAIELAPESDYAREAHESLQAAVSQDNRLAAQLVNFEVDWLDGAQPPLGEGSEVQPLDRPSPWWVRLESGALYNSNVALAPISRELSAGDQASFQVYVAPQLEYRFVQCDAWNLGTLLRGYYNLNEDNFRQYNLQHQEAGVFLERLAAGDNFDLVSRLEYGFTYDLFDGRTLGTRHALNASLSALMSGGRTWVLYAAADYTDFRDDGVDESITSLDGSSQTLGLSHAWLFDRPWLSLLRLGADLQNAPLTGSSYAYHGLMFYADAEVPVPGGCLFILQGAQGFRRYPDFEFTPDRDETIWRAGAELRKPLSPHWSISGNFIYDRFASNNELFDASRYTTGMFVTFLH